VVVLFAVLTGVHFELVGDVAALVPQEAVKLIVHVAAAKGLDEGLVVEGVEH